MDLKPTKDTEPRSTKRRYVATDLAHIIGAALRPSGLFCKASAEAPEESETRKLGRLGEQQAARYLKKHGYKVLLRNVRLGKGEIDLVCRHQETLVFVEVKTRQYNPRYRPSDSVDRRKRKKLIHSALLYLRELDDPEVTVRFDIVEVMLHGINHWECSLIQNAFGVDFQN